MEQFVAAGAREDILYDAKVRRGTDVLLTVVQNLRKRIISLGGEIATPRYRPLYGERTPDRA